ncbi:hypothetical protein [Actinoplanes sp. L3-i22]|uniref:hypothetical protein n=1 Tax=Actinoplanes sp. L3-i22 TaxID=2836373 RepID=UPI001C791419|nr:hypothetical protein [Actinoplanes sp. L3-i22]BCY06189.1 hypothetical protein L3i22_012770 [Actinoplanes sp. L3-i22]
MADTEPGQHTPATGMPDPTRVAGSSDEPPTGVLPSRWSGAAPVPEVAPRKSLWGRLVDRVSGEPEPDPEDYWATMPAVDPWAGQDTPVWTTEHLAPAGAPPTRVDAPAEHLPPTRFDNPAAPGPPRAQTGQPAPAKVDFPAKVAALLDQLGAKAAQVAEARNAKAPAGAPAAVPPKPFAPPQPAAGPPAPPRGWFRKPKASASPAPQRVPVQPRPKEATRPPWTPPRPRRKRRRLRRLLLVIAVLVAAWFGAPYAYDQWPVLGQFPVTAQLPDRLGDLRLRIDDASQKAVDRLADQLAEAGADGQAFAGVYSDSGGKKVTLYGVTGWRFTPQSDVSGQLARIAGDTKLSDVRDFDTGEFGAFESCGAGRLNGTSTVICTWADHGSMATVLLTRRSVSESAELVANLRGEVLTPRFGA